MSLVYEMQWNTEVFERTYDKIISMGGLFREYWRKAKSSPNKQLKAQIYLKMIMRKMVYTLTLLIKEGNL